MQSNESRLVVTPDFEIRLDFEQNLYGWRVERFGREWVNRDLLPLRAELVHALLRFQKGAVLSDVVDELVSSTRLSREELVAFFDELRQLGVLEPVGTPPQRPDHRFLPLDLEPGFAPIYDRAKDFTRQSVAKLYALYNACKYVVECGIPGDFAECGVWQGGSGIVSALTWLAGGDAGRRIYLYDTFEGMPEPAEKDVLFDGKTRIPKGTFAVSLEQVRQNLLQTEYPEENFGFIKGMVENTLPKHAPEQLSVLRLDTDFYDSTYHALVHLFPRLVPGGVLLLDDYGSMKSAREAIERYFTEHRIQILVNRIERLGIAVKTS